MKIKELQKVIQELPFNKRMKPDLLGLKNDNVEKLYHLIKKGKVQSEEDAIQEIYPSNRFPSRSLWKLKENLIERIGNTLIHKYPFIEVCPFQKKHINGYYYLLLLKICIALRINPLIEEYGNKCLKIGMEYHITELCLVAAMYLRGYYIVQSPNKKELTIILDLYKKYQDLLITESKLEDLQIELLMLLRDKVSFDKDSKRELDAIYRKTQVLSQKQSSYRILFRSTHIISTYFHTLMDYPRATEIIVKTQKKMQNLSMIPFQKHSFTFEFKKIPGYLIERDFNNAVETINVCLNITKKNSHNYLITNQIKALIYFHKREYENAFSLSASIYQVNKVLNESWEIYNAYASILTNRHFRLRRFLNQVPVFSKDKKGMNINILIIEILEYLRKKVYSKVIDRTSALQRYSYRYLMDDNSTYRSYQFFQIILCLEKGAFCKKEVVPLAEPYLRALKEHPLSKAQQDYELEVVPYEHLWEFIQNCLR